MEDSCSAVHRANTGIHLALDIVSTLVLGASTYVMEGLCASSRAEVDAAHANS